VIDWKMEIKKAENGYLVTTWEETDDGVFPIYEVFEEDGEDDLTAMVDLLYRVMEYLGVVSSKHNEKNIYIRIENPT
jgi:hypothetical protein